MDFGIALAPGVDAWKVVERAERLGFTHAWFYDTQMLCADVFVAMALAATHTAKIVLGTGVLVPSNRIAPVAANALASLNRLAPGRIVFGVSTGFTARNTMGLGPMKLGELREYVRVVQALLRGETVEWASEGARRKIRFLNPEAGLVDIAHPIPLHLSAFAPKARALTAEIADGWMTFVTVLPTALHAVEETAAPRRRPRAREPLQDGLHARLRAARGRGRGEPARPGAGRAARAGHVPRLPRAHRGPGAARARAGCGGDGLPRAVRDLHAARRALPPAPQGPPHVGATRGGALRHPRADPHGDLYRDGAGAPRPHPRARRRGLPAAGGAGRAGAGGCARGLGGAGGHPVRPAA